MSGSNDSPGSDPFAPTFEDWQKRCFEYTLTGKNKPPHPTIQMLWDSFSASIGVGLPPPLADLVKQSFYGGALGFFFTMNKITEVWNEDEACRIMDKLQAELGDYMQDVAKAKGVTVPNSPTSSIIQ